LVNTGFNLFLIKKIDVAKKYVNKSSQSYVPGIKLISCKYSLVAAKQQQRKIQIRNDLEKTPFQMNQTVSSREKNHNPSGRLYKIQSGTLFENKGK